MWGGAGSCRLPGSEVQILYLSRVALCVTAARLLLSAWEAHDIIGRNPDLVLDYRELEAGLNIHSLILSIS